MTGLEECLPTPFLDCVRKEANSARASYVAPARELVAFQLGNERVDVRGWPVYASDARRVGVVDRIMIEQSSRRVRYISVSLAADAADDTGRTPTGCVLVPIGIVRRYDRQQAVVVDGVNSSQLVGAPRLHARPVTRADEINALVSYDLAPSTDPQSGEFYEHPLFDERRLRISASS